MNEGANERVTQRRTVFVVHGRDLAARDAIVGLLRAFDLRIFSWDEAAAETGVATPYTGDVVAAGMSAADGVLVLFTPDDVGFVKDQFRLENDGRGELEPTGQARLNVVFEAGMAMARDRDRVVLVELGAVRPMSDTTGLNVVQLEDTAASRRKLAGRLRTAGLAVDTNNDDWPTAGQIQAVIDARRPATVAARFDPTDALVAVEPSAIDLLKSYLPDATKRIHLTDLIERETAAVVNEIVERPAYIERLDPASYEIELDDLLEATRPLLELVVVGVRHDNDAAFGQLWTSTIERLMRVRRAPRNGERFQELMEKARHYPALVVARSAGIVALHSHNSDIFLHMLKDAKWKDWQGLGGTESAASALHDYRVLDAEAVNTLPRWEGTRWIYPLSHFLRGELEGETATSIPDQEDYLTACDRYEYRVALLQQALDVNSYRSAPGEFIGDRKWTRDNIPIAEVDFSEEAASASSDWAWWRVFTNPAHLTATQEALRESLVQMRRRF